MSNHYTKDYCSRFLQVISCEFWQRLCAVCIAEEPQFQVYSFSSFRSGTISSF